MKFTPKETFQHTPQGLDPVAAKGVAFVWEEGNTYDSAAQGLSDAEVLYFRDNGWAEVEGQDPAPPRDPGNVTLTPDTAAHANEAPEVGNNG